MDSARWGRWVESAVGAHLMNWAEEHDYRVFYWRDGNDEVDFVIQRGLEEIVAIEVKSGKRTDNQGIHIFADSFHPKHSIVVGGAGISLEQFLLLSPENLF